MLYYPQISMRSLRKAFNEEFWVYSEDFSGGRASLFFPACITIDGGQDEE